MNGYKELLNGISDIYTNAGEQAARSVNNVLINTYWEIGRHIVELEQGGKTKATYGIALLENLSDDIRRLHGKGFSRHNLNNMRMFYLRYPICQKLSDKLSWSHYVELLKVENDLECSLTIHH